MKNRTLHAITATMIFAATTLLLTGCPNELFDEISEDVLVESAGGRPEIVARFPEPDASGVLSATTIRAEFDMDIDPASLTDSVQLFLDSTETEPLSGDISYNADTRTIIFTPDEPLSLESSYRVEFQHTIQNRGGAALASDIGWAFTTTDVNPNQLRVDLSTQLTPIVSASSPLYLTVIPFPIDVAGFKAFGPYESGDQTLVFDQADLTDNPDQTGFVLFFTHDQDANTETSDPGWIYLDGANGNASPNLYNGITEFNALEPSVEANPDLEVTLGSRYTVEIAASGADDHPDSYVSVNGSEFTNSNFTDLNDAFNGKVLLEAESRYFGEWFSFTVPDGKTGTYELTTSKFSDTVDIYHSMYLYEQTPSGPNELGREFSDFTSTSFGTPYLNLNTNDDSDLTSGTTLDLVAGTTYYLSIYTFWIQSFNTPIKSGSYYIEFIGPN